MFLTCIDSCKPFVNEHGKCVYPFEPHFSLDICPGVGLLDHIVALFLFLKEAFTVLHGGLPMYIPMNRGGSFPFLHTLERVNA